MNLTWSHAFVNVADLPSMLSFYCNILGFKISDRTADTAFLSQLDGEHHQLAFHQSSNTGEPAARVGHFAFRVHSIDDVRALHARLSTLKDNVKVIPITHGNTWSIYFNDPEGNGIEVFCDTPWEVEQPFSKPWDTEISQDELETYTKQLITESKV